MAEPTEDSTKPRSSTPVSTYGEKPKIVKLTADGIEYYIGSEVFRYLNLLYYSYFINLFYFINMFIII